MRLCGGQGGNEVDHALLGFLAYNSSLHPIRRHMSSMTLDAWFDSREIFDELKYV